MTVVNLKATKVNDGATSESNLHIDGEKGKETTNEYVLNVAFFSFFIFMTAQAFFALMANSQSMMADSMAMSIDAFTYLFNLMAERLKHRTPTSFGSQEPLSMEESRQRKKLMRLYLEFVPPLISVTALIVISIQVLLEALKNLMKSDEPTDESPPDLKLMFIFSCLNLLLDVMNVSCFAKIQDSTIPSMETLQVKSEYDDVSHSDKSGSRVSEKEQPTATKVDQIALEQGPTKSYPPSIVHESSIESSSSDNDEDCDEENLGLLGISIPNYGTQLSVDDWVSDVSTGSNEKNSSPSMGPKSPELLAMRNDGTIESRRLDVIHDDLDGISEGDESLEDGLSVDTDDSEKSGKGFNLNMCSAYTVSLFRRLSFVILCACS